MAEEYIDKDDRFRAGSLFDFISRYIGEYHLEDQKEAINRPDESAVYDPGMMRLPEESKGNQMLEARDKPDNYSLFGKWTSDPLAHIGEEQLLRSLFKMDPSEHEQISEFGQDVRVFDVRPVEGEEIFTLADTKHGNDFQNILNSRVNQGIAMHAKVWGRMKNSGNDDEAAEYLEAAKTELMFRNPDTGETQYKFREGMLGDIYLDKDLKFIDYWNIDLDTNETINSKSNILRFGAAPFTKPPTVMGEIELWGKNANDHSELETFYKALFTDRTAEEKIMKEMLESEDAYLEMILDGTLFE